MSYDLPNEEKAVDHVKLLPEIHSLHKQNKTSKMLIVVIIVLTCSRVERNNSK